MNLTKKLRPLLLTLGLITYSGLALFGSFAARRTTSQNSKNTQQRSSTRYPKDSQKKSSREYSQNTNKRGSNKYSDASQPNRSQSNNRKNNTKSNFYKNNNNNYDRNSDCSPLYDYFNSNNGDDCYIPSLNWNNQDCDYDYNGNGNSNSNSNSNNNGNSNYPWDNSNPWQSDPYESNDVVEIVNNERARRGLNALTSNAQLTQAANIRAQEISQYFDHTRPNGSPYYTVLSNIRNTASGENIAYGQSNAQSVMSDWMNSSGHRANILSETYTQIGIGYYVSNNTKYWVQLFIR